MDLIEYLVQNGLHLGNKVRLQAGVTDWIWSNPEYIKACLRGLIDTDGCFALHKYKVNGKEYRYPKMVFTNSSILILDFVQVGLKQLGFHPKRFLQKKIWLYNQNEVKRCLREIGTNNYIPVVKIILEGC